MSFIFITIIIINTKSYFIIFVSEGWPTRSLAMHRFHVCPTENWVAFVISLKVLVLMFSKIGKLAFVICNKEL